MAMIDGQETVVRKAAPADRPALVALMAELQDHERRLHPSLLPGAEIADSHLSHLERAVAAQDGAILVAACADLVLGFAICLIEEPTDHTLGPGYRRFGVVTDIVVAAEARGRGIGKALIAAAEEHLAAQGVRQVQIAHLAGNRVAALRYAASGYQPYLTILAKRIGGGTASAED